MEYKALAEVLKNTCKIKSSSNSRFAVLATMLIIGIHGLDYTDLEATKVACPLVDSCAERSNISRARNCECDYECCIYNDCCIDSKNLYEKGLNSSRFSCMPEKDASIYGVYVLSTCQQNWQGPAEIKNKCEILNDLSDPLMTTPATDKRRGLSYRSRYCAECNNAVPDELTYWVTLTYCLTQSNVIVKHNFEDLTYRRDLNEWGFTKDNVYYPCSISFELPESLERNVRECMVNLIGTCPSTWRRRRVKSLCEAYMAMVKYGDTFYRNPHCALCNGVRLDKRECFPILGARIAPSIAFLFDASRSDGGIVGMTTPSCPEGQNYDPFFKKCRELSCGLPGFTMVDGNCVKT